ncbi:hypothetical protein BASA81_004169 [Batrachochytrium salamandrivorans]|nr:hypothetical protein BASA81_004169 [Batrachochytrium salamandrivorans]
MEPQAQESSHPPAPFPAQHLGTVLSLWHLFHSGFVSTSPSSFSGEESDFCFTPQELEQALLDARPESQSSLIVAIHVALIKLISRSAAGTNTVTWRATMARILSYGGGNRVRNRLRTLQDKYDRLPGRSLSMVAVDEVGEDIELGAIFGAMALHPFFSSEAKQQFQQVAKADDVFDEAQALLAPYGKSSVDTMEILLGLAKFQGKSARRRQQQPPAVSSQPMEVIEGTDQMRTSGGRFASNAPQISTTTTTVEEEAEEPKFPRYHNLHKKQERDGAEQESLTERSAEEAERICQALIQFETTEYALLPLEIKCFVLDYLVEYFMDTRHVKELLEQAMEEAEQLEVMLEELQFAHQQLELASQPRQVEFILQALRERTRLETLRIIAANEWQANHLDNVSFNGNLNEDYNGQDQDDGNDDEEVNNGRKAKLTARTSNANIGGRKIKPETYLGKQLNRFLYNVSAPAQVTSYDEVKDMFRVEYMNEGENFGLFEYLPVTDVRKPVSKKCSDEVFISTHCSDQVLHTLSADQLELVREHFTSQGIRKDRQLAIARLAELGPSTNDLYVGGEVKCGCFGKGFVLNVTPDVVHVRFGFGSWGALQPTIVSVWREPVPSREAFLQETSAKVQEITNCRERLTRCREMIRFSPATDVKQSETCASIYPMPYAPTQFVLLCPDHDNDELCHVRTEFNLPFPNPVGQLPLPSNPFHLPVYLLPEVLQTKVLTNHLSLTEASQPIALTLLVVGRLESDLFPWLAPTQANNIADTSLRAIKQRLLELETRLMNGLASMAILQHFPKPQPKQQTDGATTNGVQNLLEQTANLTCPDRPPFTTKNVSRFRKSTGYRDLLAQFPSFEEAWQTNKAGLIQSMIWDDINSSQVIHTALDAFWDQQVCTKWQQLCQARGNLESAHSADTKQYSMDPAIAVLSDGALMFLLRWLPLRKMWRNRIMSYAQSFSELIGCGVQLERASYELRRAGATFGIARDKVFRRNARACYFPSLHAASSQEEVLHLPSVTPPPPIEGKGLGSDEPKILRIKRVELHSEFYYLTFQTSSSSLQEDDENENDQGEGEEEGGEENDGMDDESYPALTPRKRPSLAIFSSGGSSSDSNADSDDSEDDEDDEETRRVRSQIEIAEDGRETSVHTRRPWYHYKIKPRIRLSVPCTYEGCEKNAVESNMGFCEDHRTVKKRGRPIGSTSVKKKKPVAKRPVSTTVGQEHDDDGEDGDYYHTGSGGGRRSAVPVAPQEIAELPATVLAGTGHTEDRCFVCLMGGELQCCDSLGCIKVYHKSCLDPSSHLPPLPAPVVEPTTNNTADTAVTMEEVPTTTTNIITDAPWFCPLHNLPADSKQSKVQRSLTGVLDAIAELDNAELIAGKVDAPMREEADDLISIRRKLILRNAYSGFDEMHQDANRLRKRFQLEAEQSGDTSLGLAVERIWKNFKVRISRAKHALEGYTPSIREPRERSVGGTGSKVLRSSYINQHQAKIAQFLANNSGNGDGGPRVYFDGETLDPNEFFEPIEFGQPIRPGKVMFNLSSAMEVSKTYHWPTTGGRDRLDRISTMNARGKRLKMDDFASAEDFDTFADEQLMVVRRDCAYLQTEKSWKRSQNESQTTRFLQEFQTAIGEFESTVTEFDRWKQEAVNAWYWICQPRAKLQPDQFHYVSLAMQHFGELAVRLNVAPKPTNAQLFLEAEDYPTTVVTTTSTNTLTTTSTTTSLEQAYQYYGKLDKSAFYNSHAMEEDEEDDELLHNTVLRVLDDACYAVDAIMQPTATSTATAALNPLVVNLVWNHRRIVRPSNQRLLALLHIRHPSSTATLQTQQRLELDTKRWCESIRVGDKVYVKLNPNTDQFGWAAEVLNSRVDLTTNSVLFDIQFDHDSDHKVHTNISAQRFFCRNPEHEKPDIPLRESAPVAVAFGNGEVRVGRVIKFDRRDINQIKVLFNPMPSQGGAAGVGAVVATADDGTFVNVNQVRSLAWIHSVIEAGKRQLTEQRGSGLTLTNKLRAPKREAQLLVNTRVKRGGNEFVHLPALFPSSAQYDSDTLDVGDYVDVYMVQQSIKAPQQIWRLAQILARTPDNKVIQLKTLQDGKVFQVDRRLVRKPQPKTTSVAASSSLQ